MSNKFAGRAFVGMNAGFGIGLIAGKFIPSQKARVITATACIIVGSALIISAIIPALNQQKGAV